MFVPPWIVNCTGELHRAEKKMKGRTACRIRVRDPGVGIGMEKEVVE
jgi:hypothetical protein